MEASLQFGNMSEDIKDKYKYARWRAGEISKAIKSGTTPRPARESTSTADDDLLRDEFGQDFDGGNDGNQQQK